MIFDYLSKCYRAPIRPYALSDDTIMVQWYRAAPGAKPFPFDNAYGATVWEDRKWFRAVGAGFVGQEGRSVKGTNPGQLGQHFDGPAEWFRTGIPLAHRNDPPARCGAGSTSGTAAGEGSATGLVGPDVRRARAELLGNAASEPVGIARGEGSATGLVGPDVRRARAELLGSATGLVGPDVRVALAELLGSAEGRGEMPFKGARAWQALFTVPSDSDSTLGFTTVDYDTDAFFNLGSDSTTLTIPTDGVYLVGFDVEILTDLTLGLANLVAVATVNGTGARDLTDGQQIDNGGATLDLGLHATTERTLTAGQVVQLLFGANLAGGGDWTVSAFLWIEFRGPIP